MGQFWHDYLYLPLLNLLLYLYGGPAFGNMGVAIIELTVLLRLALLPLTIIDEGNRSLYERLSRKMEALERDFKADHVKRKEKLRQLLKENKVNYWAKVVVLGIQAIVLVLLYQVFMGGLRFDGAAALYSWVNMPGAINTTFLGFELSKYSKFWPALVAVTLFVEIYNVQKKRAHLVTRSDVMYMLFFPLFTLVALLLLPMVKSLFILSSMIFSMVVFWLRQAFFPVKPT